MSSVNERQRKLVQAIASNDVPAVKQAVRSGADLELVDASTGDAPLEFAIAVASTEVVSILLEAGADPNKLGRLGMRPLQVAIDRSVEDANYSYDTGNGLVDQDTAVLKLLLDAGADPNMRDEFGKTAVQEAKDRDHVPAQKLFQTYSRPVRPPKPADPYR